MPATIEDQVDGFVQNVIGSLVPFVARVIVNFDPAAVLDLAAVELSVNYPQAKVALPGTGNTPEVNGRLTNLVAGSSITPLGNDDDDKLRIIFGGGSPTDVPSGPVVRISFDQPGPAPLASEFSCTVTDAFDSFGLSVSGVTCAVAAP